MLNNKVILTMAFAAVVSAHGQPADTVYVFNVEKVADHPHVIFPRDAMSQ